MLIGRALMRVGMNSTLRIPVYNNRNIQKPRHDDDLPAESFIASLESRCHGVIKEWVKLC